MVTDRLSLVFGALADPTRRAILTRLAEGEAAVAEIAVTTTTRVKDRVALPRRRANSLLWSAQILLAAVFVFAAIPKLAGAHSAVRQQIRSLAAAIRR